MLKMIILCLFFTPNSIAQKSLQFYFNNCPAVTNFQKTGQSSGAISFAWNGNSSATGYILVYTRQEDSYSSTEFFTTNSTYSFSNLPSGHYTFYVAAVYVEGRSSFIGVEDIIEN